MPDSASSLVLYVSLALPGFVFFSLRSQRKLSPDRSALVETASLAAAGVLADIVALVPVVAVARVWPGIGLDLRELLIDGRTYVADELDRVLLWWIGFLAIACVIAVVLATRDLAGNRFLKIFRGPIVSDSSWELVFNAPDLANLAKWCVCSLIDGRVVSGRLASSSPDPRETGDRDLVLAPPIGYDGGDGAWLDSDAQRVVLRAADIVLLEVRYSEAPPAVPASDCSPTAV